MTRRVSRLVDLGSLPALTPAQEVELAALVALPDDRIDTGDAPALPPEAWDGAVRGRFY